MLIILRPFWNMASLVCYDAPVKKGYRNNTFPMNGNDRNNGHQMEWNARFTEQINRCNVLLVAEKKTWCFFSRLKGRRCLLPLGAPPPPSAPAIWWEKKVPPLQTQCHNLSNNYIEMEHCNDGNFYITREISSALRAKIARGLVTPWQSGVPF